MESQLISPNAISHIPNPTICHHAKAPAVSLAEHTEALREDLRLHADMPVQLSTTGVLGTSKKNAARQYKRAVSRFGFALNLGFVLKNPFVFGHGCNFPIDHGN